jgi:hypothetical protein
MASVFLDAFLDGFTGGGLFTRLQQPGAATQVFADDPVANCMEAAAQQPGAAAQVFADDPVAERMEVMAFSSVSALQEYLAKSDFDVLKRAIVKAEIEKTRLSLIHEMLESEIGEHGTREVETLIRRLKGGAAIQNPSHKAHARQQ